MNKKIITADSLIGDECGHVLAARLLRMREKSLIECFLFEPVPGERLVDLKRDALDEINTQLSTKYNMNHINNWLAGRVQTPKRVKMIMQLGVLQYLFNDDVAQILHEILHG